MSEANEFAAKEFATKDSGPSQNPEALRSRMRRAAAETKAQQIQETIAYHTQRLGSAALAEALVEWLLSTEAAEPWPNTFERLMAFGRPRDLAPVPPTPAHEVAKIVPGSIVHHNKRCVSGCREARAGDCPDCEVVAISGEHVLVYTLASGLNEDSWKTRLGYARDTATLRLESLHLAPAAKQKPATKSKVESEPEAQSFTTAPPEARSPRPTLPPELHDALVTLQSLRSNSN